MNMIDPNKEYLDTFKYIFEPDAIKEIAKYGEFKKFNQEDIIVDIGQRMSHIAIVVSGTIKVSTENEVGDDLFLYYLETGETCAISLNCFTAKINDKIRAAAETDVVVAMLPSSKLDEWMSKFSSWRRFIIENYSHRMFEMVGAIDSLAFNNMEDRVVKYLNNKVWAHNSKTLHVTHAEIANDLNSSRVVISRIMKKLEKANYLSQSRNKIEMINH